ncbi:MAG: class II aldolase/adducin family protein [Chloroflexi bacterium]|nr:class II aldolase/adducin family protein [Chloroflexota bacterium]
MQQVVSSKGASITNEEELKNKLVTMTRIIVKERMFGPFGHISVRVPGKELFYITPGQFGNKQGIGVDDLVGVDFRGKKVSGANAPPRETVIHTVLHRRREDAAAIAHLHSYYATTLSICGMKFVPLHVNARPFVDNPPPVWVDADLIITEDEGEKLAKFAGNAPAVLMRGHGAVTIGKSIEELLLVTLTLEEESRRLIETASISTVMPLTADEFRHFKHRTLDLDRMAGKTWETCVAEL